MCIQFLQRKKMAQFRELSENYEATVQQRASMKDTTLYVSIFLSEKDHSILTPCLHNMQTIFQQKKNNKTSDLKTKGFSYMSMNVFSN